MPKAKVARSETQRTRPPTRKARTLPMRAVKAAEEEPIKVADQEFESVKSEPMPPPPPPPKVEVITSTAGGKKGRWQDKYETGFAGGREGLCKQAGQLYCSLLAKFCEYIESKGGKPIMGLSDIEETILPAAILTADKFLPDVEVGPETEVAVGSGLIIGQAAIVAMRSRKKGPGKSSNGAPPTKPSTDDAQEAKPPLDEPVVVYDMTDPKTVY